MQPHLRKTQRHHWLTLSRDALGVALSAGAALGLHLWPGPWQLQPTDQVTAMACVAAMLAASLGLHRTSWFTRGPVMTYVFAVTSVAFSLLLSYIVLARMPYSRSLLALCYALSLGWFALHYCAWRYRFPPPFALVAGRRCEAIRPLVKDRWPMIDRPEPPRCDSLCGLIADLSESLSAEWSRFLSTATMQGIPVYDAGAVREMLTGRVSLDGLRESMMDSLVPSSFYLWFKRVPDTALAVLSLPLTLPLAALVACAIKLNSKGPALFSNQRTGQGGKPFRMIKFRSMTMPDASGGAQRVTVVGRFLRRLRLDELPQLWNVLRGDMSLIGPRPEDEALSRSYEREIPFYRWKYAIKPGMTGWAQVRHGHTRALDMALTREKLEYDFYYLKHFSFWLDVNIALRTVWVALSGRGAS